MRAAHPWWYVRITGIRVDIEVILDVWPHLRARVERDFAEAYGHGRKVGSEELGVPPETFPDTSPWTLEQVLTAPLDGPVSPFFEE